MARVQFFSLDLKTIDKQRSIVQLVNTPLPLPWGHRYHQYEHLNGDGKGPMCLSVSKGPIFTDKMAIKQWETWCCLTTSGHHCFLGPRILRRNRVMISYDFALLVLLARPTISLGECQRFCMADLIKSESLRGTIPRANLSDLGTIKICADRLVLYGSQSRTMTVRYVWIRLSHCL